MNEKDLGDHLDKHLDEIRSAAEHLPLPNVPPAVARKLRAAYEERLPRVVAKLVSDTRDQRELVGTRGGSGAAWTMAYQGGDCDVLLDIVPTDGGLRLAGQLLCPGPTSDALVRVFEEDQLITGGSTDVVGQFDLGILRPARYVVAAVTDHDVLELTADLRERDSTAGAS